MSGTSRPWRPVLLLVLLVGGCARPDVVARIGNETLDFGGYQTFVAQRAGAEWSVLEEKVLGELFELFVDEALMVKLAREEGLVDASASREDALERIRIRATGATVSDDEVAGYLAEHPERSRRPERLVLGQILVQDRELAQKLHEEIRAGADFEEVGRRAAAADGVLFAGYQNDVSAADLPTGFRDTLFALTPGAVSEVLEADYGFLIFHVRDRSPAATVPLEEAAAEARARLVEEKADTILRDMLARARERYRVEVLDWNLPFLLDVDEPAHEAAR